MLGESAKSCATERVNFFMFFKLCTTLSFFKLITFSSWLTDWQSDMEEAKHYKCFNFLVHSEKVVIVLYTFQNWETNWLHVIYNLFLQIHWFSIFNSFMMVIFLVGLVSMILMRTLRKDYARYSKEDDLDEMVSTIHPSYVGEDKDSFWWLAKFRKS